MHLPFRQNSRRFPDFKLERSLEENAKKLNEAINDASQPKKGQNVPIA